MCCRGDDLLEGLLKGLRVRAAGLMLFIVSICWWTCQPESQATNRTTVPTTRASTSNEPHMCVTSHMGPITSRTDPRLVQGIPQRIPQRIPPRDVQGIQQRIDKGLETIRGNLESSHNFNIISELNVISAIQWREYCFSFNIILKLSWQSSKRSPVRAIEKRISSTGDSQKEGRLVEAHTKVKCKDLRAIHSMLGHRATPQSLASC